MLNTYAVYTDDGKNVNKIIIPAKNEKEAGCYANGNGEIVAVKNITEEYPIGLNYLKDTLRNAHYGNIEMDIIIRALEQSIYTVE